MEVHEGNDEQSTKKENATEDPLLPWQLAELKKLFGVDANIDVFNSRVVASFERLDLFLLRGQG